VNDTYFLYGQAHAATDLTDAMATPSGVDPDLKYRADADSEDPQLCAVSHLVARSICVRWTHDTRR